MGFRFQKRITIFPGLKINLSKRGVSASVGVRGAQITKGHGQTRLTVGLPGSGLSHSRVINKTPSALIAAMPADADAAGAKAPASRRQRMLGFIFIAAFVSTLLFIFLTNQGTL